MIYNEVVNWVNEETKSRLRSNISQEENINLLEGERLGIANKIASSIGVYLDKAIYKKFKFTMKNAKK